MEYYLGSCVAIMRTVADGIVNACVLAIKNLDFWSCIIRNKPWLRYLLRYQIGNLLVVLVIIVILV